MAKIATVVNTFGAALIVFALSAPVAAQDRPSPAIEVEGGWVGFADDGVVSETMAGGAARWYASPRLSIGPEVIYIAGSNHSHLVVTGNATYDVLAPINGRPRGVTPFVVAGGGIFQTREEFFGQSFTSTEGAFTAGGGVRVAAGDRLTIGVDARIGWELHLRVNGFVGINLR